MHNMSVIVSDLLIILVFSAATVLLFAARTENVIAEHYIKNPCFAHGQIKELCKATLPARRETRYSGFDYVIVEYEYDSVVRTAKLMRTKQDFEMRSIELVIDRERPAIVVRKEYETPNDIAVRYFIYVGFFLVAFKYGNFVRNMIEAVICGAAIYYFRRPLILHIYDNRKEEWQGTSSIVKSDGSLPPKVILLAFLFALFIGFLITWLVLNT